MHKHYGTCRGSVWFFADGFLKNYLVTWRPVVPSKQPGGEILKGGSRYTPFLHQSWKWKILENDGKWPVGDTCPLQTGGLPLPC